MNAGEFAIGAVGAVSPSPLTEMGGSLTPPAAGVHGTSFADMLVGGIEGVEAKVAHANEMANAFVLDDNIPVHQVTFALEDARLALELAMQVRTRLVETYQQLMGMQL